VRPAAGRPPDCLRCSAYFVTHVADHPHGCRTFAMKSKSLPSIAVREASGRECGAFEPRGDHPLRRPGGPRRDRA
jgi:hypothetical protein